TAAFIFAVGAAAMVTALEASRAAPANNRIACFIFPLPIILFEPSLAYFREATLGRDMNWIARLLFGGMDHQRTLDAGDILFHRHGVGDEALKRRQVASDAFEDEIHFAGKHVALAHFRPAARAFLEMLEIAVFLARQTDKDKTGDFKAQRFSVQLGVIAFDITGFLKRADAAQTRRRGDLGAARQLDIGDA